MLRAGLSVLALLAATLFAGCGDDGDPKDDPSADATTSSASDPTSASTADPEGSDTATGSSGSASADAGNSEKVDATAAKAGCTAEPGTVGFTGETEHECGALLIVDWSTSGLSEEEMFTEIDNWVDDTRPLWLYAGDMVLVYGTKADLDAISSEFE